MPAGVGVFERVVQHIAVTVVVLAVLWGLNVGVGAEESPDFGVVQPRIHVD